jgi:glycine/D-amino acid oxidase-like deaminating enzyme
MPRNKTAIVIGGGFYGSAIAIHLAQQGCGVTLVEKEPELIGRASYVNQARLHNGCHYPRSFRTAIRSRANLPHFRDIYGEAVFDRFRALYAIASRDSRVSAQHYQRFCRAAQIALRPAKREDRALFDSRLVEAVYEVDEPAFNATALRDKLTAEIGNHRVAVRCNTMATSIAPTTSTGDELQVRLSSGETLSADWVFNCTYAALNHIDGRANIRRPALRHQIAEIVLIRPPAELQERGVTLMDGPFFSTMPFPARKLHSLTHVRYTHHVAWLEGGENAGPEPVRGPLELLSDYLAAGGGPKGRSRANWMLRDAQRFLPVLAKANIEDTLFEVKTFVAETEVDDARPIYFHQDETMPRLISILGSKIDNVFDILIYVDRAVGQA